MSITDVMNRVWRESRRYTGDGLPNPPTGAPLPIGDPVSGPHNPSKAELRAAFAVVAADLTAGVTDAQAAQTAAESAAANASATAARAIFATVSALIADNNAIIGYSGGGAALTVLAGGIVEAGGYRYEVAASGASDHHVATAGGVKLYVLPTNGAYAVKAFGAAGDGVTDDVATINAAIDAVSAAGGGRLYFDNSVYMVGRGPAIFVDRDAAVVLKPGVILSGHGTIRRLGTAMDFDMVYGGGSGTFPDLVDTMGIEGLTIDGRASARVDGQAGAGLVTDGFNIWLQNVLDPVVYDVVSLDAPSWSIRIELCTGTHARVGNVSVTAGADVNADGVHFIDCRDFTGDTFNIFSEGDDGFIVEAKNHDILNMHLTGITVRCPLGVNAGGRGVLILRETLGGTITSPVTFKNIRIEAVAENCGGASNAGVGLALQPEYATIDGCVFDIMAYRCSGGVACYLGFNGTGGVMKNSVIRLIETDSDGDNTNIVGSTGAEFSNNYLEITQSNPNDGIVGVALEGNNFSGYIHVDYNPNADKSLLQPAIAYQGNYSSLHVRATGANYNLRVLDGSTDNTFYVGRLQGATLGDVLLEGTGADTVFIGGYINGAMTGLTAGTQFIGTKGPFVP